MADGMRAEGCHAGAADASGGDGGSAARGCIERGVAGRGLRRGSGRPRLAAGLVLLAAFAAVVLAPVPATAQTVDLVGNSGEEVFAGSSNLVQAQSFGTGTNDDGYKVSEVRIRLRARNSTARANVKIREDNASNRPGDLVAAFPNPSLSSTASFHTFTAPANTRLDADTTYWITVNEGATTGVTLDATRTARPSCSV